MQTHHCVCLIFFVVLIAQEENLHIKHLCRNTLLVKRRGQHHHVCNMSVCVSAAVTLVHGKDDVHESLLLKIKTFSFFVKLLYLWLKSKSQTDCMYTHSHPCTLMGLVIFYRKHPSAHTNTQPSSLCFTNTELCFSLQTESVIGQIRPVTGIHAHKHTHRFSLCSILFLPAGSCFSCPRAATSPLNWGTSLNGK